MKEQILKVAKDLEQGDITEDEAQDLLLCLFSVSWRSEQLAVWAEWLKDNYSISIPDMVIEEYKRYNG